MRLALRLNGTTACKWDVIIPFDALWEQYKRIVKPNAAIVLTASQPFTSQLVMSNPKWFKYEWIWEKNLVSNFANAKKQPMRSHENILIFCQESTIYNPQFREYGKKTKARYPQGGTPLQGNNTKFSVYRDIGANRSPLDFERGAYPISICKIDAVPNCNSARLHPTQKPVALFEYLIKTYTNEGDLILDNCAGSGTTAIAAINTNRNYILMEKELDYFEVIKERIAKHSPKDYSVIPDNPTLEKNGQLALF